MLNQGSTINVNKEIIPLGLGRSNINNLPMQEPKINMGLHNPNRSYEVFPYQANIPNLNHHNHNIFTKLNDNFKSRREETIRGCDVFKQLNCCSCGLNATKIKVISSILEYIEKSSEISNLIKLSRHLEISKGLMLRDTQEKIYLLPSININYLVEQDIEDNENKENISDDDCNKINEDTLIEFETLDYEDKRNKNLVLSIIKSII